MNSDRRMRLWGLVVERAHQMPVTFEHVCVAMVTQASVDGVSMTVTLPAGARETLFASNQVASDLAELSLVLGEGPSIDAFAGGPALVADLTDAESLTRWPVFTPAAVAAGARATFALPLQVGGVRLGVIDLYRGQSGALSRDQLADSLTLADTACGLLLDSAQNGHSGRNGQRPDQAVPQHAEVHQATGMVIVQLGVSAAVALVRLRAYAYANDRHLRDVARDVVARRLRFHPDGEGD